MASAAAEDRPPPPEIPSPAPQVELTKEDRKILEMLELLEMLDMLKDIQEISSLEDDRR